MASEAPGVASTAPPVPPVWRKKPLYEAGYIAVTTPRTVTVWPTHGEVSPVPWTPAMVVPSQSTGATGPSPFELTGAGAAVLKSALLLSVSTPVALRVTAVVCDGAGAAEPSLLGVVP